MGKQLKGVLGTKLGMTQVFNDQGRVVPVTVVAAGPCVVTAVRTAPQDGYAAVQLGYGEIDPRRVTKPVAGHFAKAGVTPRRYLVELRTDDADQYTLGQELTAETFGAGDLVDVTGRSKGKGTACTVSRGTVVRTLPIRPAIFTPLNTRPGVAHPPIDPGERCLRWVPWEEPRPLKPCRFITPAVPLPLLRPVTSTRSPAPNVSAVTSWPSVYWSASSVRSSTR